MSAQLTDRELLEQLAAQRFKAVGTPPNAQYVHGRTGLLSTPGLDPNIISAMILPTGLAVTLPVRTSRQTDRIVGILTGMTASTGDEPTAACADFPEVGDFKLCQQTLPFGRIGRETQIVQLDRVGEITNRGEFLDHTLANNPFGDMEMPVPVSPAEALRAEAAKQLLALNVGLLRDYADLIFTGNPANTAGSAGYIEYNGLDRLINTGYRDAVTGVACAAADSLIRDFGSVNVATDAGNTLNVITEMVNFLMHLAEQTKISGVEWDLVMRYGAFRALTRIWPCSYLTYQCQPLGDDARVNIDARDAVELRDDMWNNHYLLIAGKKVRVILDEAIPQTGAAGTFVSDIYIVPRGVVGGEPTLYWEFFDMRLVNPAIEALTPTGSFQVVGGGRFLLHKKPPTNECIKARLIGKPRLILRTPFLAGKLENVAYTTYINERSPFPGDANFYNGGNTEYSSPSFYTFVP